jgi:hypothetical protein
VDGIVDQKYVCQPNHDVVPGLKYRKEEVSIRIRVHFVKVVASVANDYRLPSELPRRVAVCIVDYSRCIVKVVVGVVTQVCLVPTTSLEKEKDP